MTAAVEQLTSAVRDWAERASRAGWLDETAHAALLEACQWRDAGELFARPDQRPLVAAFFGGTGVGKSTLLNRLAQAPVARTGVVRPTSREVTLFVHDSVLLTRLPAHLPLDKVNVARHASEAFREVVWIDTPDIDSIDSENRDLALAWLPHVDLVVYVVSPDRYRDDKAWRVLRAQGCAHAWMFVMNQADLGCPEQIADFKLILAEAGFQDPLVFATACTAPGAADQFDLWCSALTELLDKHTRRDLFRQSQKQALIQLAEALQGAIRDVAAGISASTELKREWKRLWEACGAELGAGLAWAIRQSSERFAAYDANPWFGSRPSARQAAPPNESRTEPEWWDAWAQTRAEDALDALVLTASEHSMPGGRLREALAPIRAVLRRQATGTMEAALRKALVRPGNRLQRFALRLTGFLQVALPLAAVSWAAYAAVLAYYDSEQNHAPYLGVEFLLHSGALVVLAGLLPFTLHRALRPSHVSAARRGLTQGLAEALAAVEARVLRVVDEVLGEHATIAEQGAELLRKVQAQLHVSEPGTVTSLLSRLRARSG